VLSAADREDRLELVRRNDLELRVGAVARRPVGPQSPELGRVPEARALRVILGHLHDELEVVLRFGP
jgi:hypothetical protein